MTTITDTALTAQHVRALKHADALCFDHTGNGQGRIRAIRRAENSSTGFEETVEIPAFSSRVQDYGRDNSGDRDYTAFAMISSARYSDVGQTIVRHLREGSAFALIWTRDNSSPITREAGVVRDELRIQVQGKSAKVADTFIVDTFIGRDNTARMVQIART